MVSIESVGMRHGATEEHFYEGVCEFEIAKQISFLAVAIHVAAGRDVLIANWCPVMLLILAAAFPQTVVMRENLEVKIDTFFWR